MAGVGNGGLVNPGGQNAGPGGDGPPLTIAPPGNGEVFFKYTVATNGQPNFTWNGGGSNNNPGTSANWAGGIAPVASAADTITFDGSSRLGPNIEQPYLVHGANFASTAGAFTVTGAQLNIGYGGISMNSTSNQTIATSGVVLANNQTWDVADASLTVSAPISGGQVLTKGGAGTLTLTGNNVYSGGTTINGGTVVVGDSAAQSSSLGTGNVTLNSGSARASARDWRARHLHGSPLQAFPRLNPGSVFSVAHGNRPQAPKFTEKAMKYCTVPVVTAKNALFGNGFGNGGPCNIWSSGSLR